MGGAAGHLSHLHEDLDITFGEIKNVLRDVASAKITAYEKVDGQNLFFTWDASLNTIMTARNPTDIKRGGMSADEYAAKWQNHPVASVRKAFTSGLAAIESAVQMLDKQDLIDIFGKSLDRWANAEIMYVDNPNMISYTGNWIVLHNLQQKSGVEDSTKTMDAFNRLVDAVREAEIDIDQEAWRVSGPQIVELKNFEENYQAAYDKLVQDIDNLGMNDESTLRDFVSEKLRASVVGDLPIPVHTQETLIDVITSKEGAPSWGELKKKLPKEVQNTAAGLASLQTRYKLLSKILAPIERAISDFAIEVLRGLNSFFVEDYSSEIDRMKNQLESSIEKLQSYTGSDAATMGAMLDKQLGKLGPIENLASTMEGIVFEYPPGSRSLYKITGSFAMMNQIVGRAMRLRNPESNMTESISRSQILQKIIKETLKKLNLTTD